MLLERDVVSELLDVNRCSKSQTVKQLPPTSGLGCVLGAVAGASFFLGGPNRSSASSSSSPENRFGAVK